ncbi:MAG: hypothetical protein ACXVZT_00645 [Terriglobales bacterium]
MTDIEMAGRWREEFGYIGRAGVIVVFEGKVQSWVNELRNPEHWQPGCVAVDEAGRTWTAVGGDAKDGASAWMPNDAASWMNRRVPPATEAGHVGDGAE